MNTSHKKYYFRHIFYTLIHGCYETLHLLFNAAQGQCAVHSEATEQLDMSTFKKGIYYLKVITKQAVQVKRVVVE